jgi:quinohemoprotein ethanol dehydrogenase
VDLKTGRPVLTPQADFSKSPKLIYPGQAGAHVWHAMSFSASSGLVYIPLTDWPMVYSYTPKDRYLPGQSAEHVSIRDYEVPAGGVEPVSLSYLQAWDPRTGQERWRVLLDDQYFGSGVLSTAGNLVIQGNGQGYLTVFAADTGAQLASINVGTSMMAAPMSYAVDGEQYIAIMAGFGGAVGWVFPKSSAAYRYGNAGRIVAFKLGGGAVPLPPVIDRVKPPAPPAIETTPEQVARGAELFNRFRCTWCHSGDVGLIPDLFALTPEKHALFKDIVYGGAFESKGMAGFSDLLSEKDVEDIHAYVVDETRKRIEAAE